MKRYVCKNRGKPTKRCRALFCFSLLLAVLSTSTLLSQYTYPGRGSWQKPDTVIKLLKIKPGMTVADIGAGDGYFVFRLAAAVTPAGQVFAVDISDYHVRELRRMARQKNMPWIKVVKARAMNPLLPDSSQDLVFLCNTYHHLQNRVTYFKNLKKNLKSRGRVVIIDFLPDHVPISGHGTATSTIKAEMKEAGYILVKEYVILPRQNFLVFSPGP